jgi:glycosyltransferase involved in cell wall biosynthesis
MPVYNGERTILETIASAQKQTFSDFELIVINDGSTDRTLEILDNIQDPRLKVFSYSNGGRALARNRGISQAKGEFIAFLDADDLWTSDKLELQLAALEQNPKAGLAYSWTCNMGENKEWFSSGKPVNFEGNVIADLLLGNFLKSGSNPLVRRQAIESTGEFDPAFTSAQDWDYWLRIATQWSFVLVSKEQIFYRQRRSSTSLIYKLEEMQVSYLMVMEKAFQSVAPELQSLKNQCLANIYLYFSELYLRYGNEIEDVKKSTRSLGKAIILYPQTLKIKHTQSLVKWIFKKWLAVRFSQNKASVIEL